MSRLARGGTVEPVSQDQIIIRREPVQGNIHFRCSADHEQDWESHPVDHYSCYMCMAILFLPTSVCYLCSVVFTNNSRTVSGDVIQQA